MKAIDYIKFYRDQIIEDLSRYGKNDSIDNFFEIINAFINEITPLRSNPRQSRAMTSEFNKKTLQKLPDTFRDTAVNWLLKAFTHDITYIYAHNWLLQNENRNEGTSIYNINIDFQEAERLLLDEQSKEEPDKETQSSNETNVFVINTNIIEAQKSLAEIKNKEKNQNDHPDVRNFGCRLEDDLLKRYYKDLTEKVDFIDEIKTTSDQFVDVFKEDWAEHEGKIYWKCETTQLAYLIDKLQSFFSNLSFLNIEKSGKFVSKKDVSITANNLYSQKSKNRGIDVKEKEKIDKIIKSLLKEQ
jgi:hypothetical protein